MRPHDHFAATDEEQSAGPQRAGEACIQMTLGILVEVDDDVPAQDHIQPRWIRDH